MRARQIDYREWHHLFRQIPEELVESTRYYRHLNDAEWSKYLFPPSTHAVYGNRLLRKLKFDNSLASLRLWGFAMSEGERLYRARQSGYRVIAEMGDLGAVTPLVHSFPDTISFYPDCLWWTPFLMESHVLFNEAAEFGLGEDCCFVRAAIGGYSKRAYFPKPDLNIGVTGATCDDMAAVMSEIALSGDEIHWFELPHRSEDNFQYSKKFLAGEHKKLCNKMEELTGVKFSESRFNDVVDKVNRLRSLIKECKELTAADGLNPIGGIEMMNVEFSALSYYADLDECLSVIEDFRDMLKARVNAKEGYTGQDIKIIWVTPAADPILINYLEELGGRIAGSEYVINQVTSRIRKDCSPFEALAEAQLQGSLMGSSAFRAQLVLDEIERTKADGAIISGIFGSSHCPFETSIIIKAVREKGLPVLAFDTAQPGKVKLQSQIYNRMQAFMESIRISRSRYAG
ncbi:MAG: 2-hydroxyacyl-CoA dehydratase [FCB group bacterium]|nr:2-hydroxyacyl-CoA dehydratase [FCB group bacterium]